MTPRYLSVASISTLVIVGGGVLVFANRAPSVASPVIGEPVVVAPPTDTPRRWIDGQVLVEGAPQPIAAAVVIDNAPEARPQSGIADASFVFEVPVEGGRTRFLAFFTLDAVISEIGPVRSARPYLAMIAHAFNAPLVHVGGSPEALKLFRTSGWAHVNQYYDPPFRRVNFRSAPFDVYAAMSGLADFIRDRGWEDDTVRTYEWGITESADTVVATAVEASVGQVIRIGWIGNPVVWTYDAGSKQYTRTQGDRAHRDANGKPVTATNVLVLKIGTKVLDEIGRLSLKFPTDMAPNGAELLQGGKRASGHWSFRGADQVAAGDSSSVALRVQRSLGEVGAKEERMGIALLIPLKLEPGTTWIELVPNDVVVE